MSSVLHRTTKQYRSSVNTPDYDPATWIINPIMPAGVPVAYCKINGDTVTEMTQTEKDTIDSTAQTARDSAADLPEHADNAAATVARLPVGTFYRTGDIMKVVHL